MIGGNPHLFIDRLYTCQDTIFTYNGAKYWFQGWMPGENNKKIHMEIFRIEPNSKKIDYVWKFDGDTLVDGVKSFEKAPVFNGKTFWSSEKDISWLDD